MERKSKMKKSYTDRLEIFDKLRGLGLDKKDLLHVVRAAMAARADSVVSDPLNAKGQLMYIHGTRELRRIHLLKGWVIDRTDNIESILHPATGIKVIYQNTDTAANPYRDPKAISKKGPASVRMINQAQGVLFPEWISAEAIRLNAQVWYLCVAHKDDEVYAELSRPLSLEDDQFGEFAERIFIKQTGDEKPFNPEEFDFADAKDFNVTVTRK